MTDKSKEDLAHEFVSKYADGGALCLDCRHSHPVDPGWGHVCKVDEGDRPVTDCPALPEELYPD